MSSIRSFFYTYVRIRTYVRLRDIQYQIFKYVYIYTYIIYTGTVVEYLCYFFPLCVATNLIFAVIW